MKNGFMKLCSIFLVLILLVNMLPLQVFAQQLNTGKTEPIAPAPSGEENTEDRVIAEIKEKRTEFSKEFLLSSGLHMITVYPEAVHYATEKEWKEIDNTLIAKADGTITNTAGVWDVSFPQQLSKDKSITIKKDGHTLSFFMAGELTGSNNAVVRAIGSTQEETLNTANMRLSTATTKMPDLTEMRASVKYAEMVPEKVSSQITYANVYQNTNIIYDLESNKVKESVVLESYRSNLRGYRYTLNVGEMIPVLEEDGQILFYDQKGENIVMVMPAPYMIDDAGARSDDVRVQLTGNGSSYTLTYLLPQQWLAAEDRAWPVILDPAVTPNMSTSNIRDRSVAEHWTSSQTWGYNACGYFNPEGIVRFFLQYQNLPHLTSSDVIVNATVEMEKAAGTASTSPIYVHKVNDTWESETITWANKPGYDSTIEDYAVVQANGDYIWDITDICRGWYDDENTGMMFKASDAVEAAQVGDYKQFYSSDYGTVLTRPILTITFRNNNGLESYWDYTSVSAGRAGTGHVNYYTGNLVWVRNDIGFGGNRMPVSINHIYNANDAQHFPDVVGDFNNSNDTAGNTFGLGFGWRTNYNQLVYQWSADASYKEYYIWEDADGTDHYFWFDEDENIYKDEDGLELTLTVIPINSLENEYRITDKNGNTSYFDIHGRLVKLENNQQTKSNITIAYVNDTYRIDYIRDGANRKYVFEYDILTELLTEIRYIGSGTEAISYVSFIYQGNKLYQIQDKDNETSTYTYVGYNLLQSVQDVDGYQLTYTYNTDAVGQPARVTSVASTHNGRDGSSLAFEYDYNLTKVTDHDGRTQIMQFNNMGNTVCIQDDEGRAQYAQFAKNDGEDTANKANQLKLSSKLQDTVVNRLNNSGFESGSAWTFPASSANVSIVSTDAHYGSKSMQISTNTVNSGAYENSYTVESGQSITFSAYVKPQSAAAMLTLYDWDLHYHSETVSAGSDWTRLEVTYTNTSPDIKYVCPHILTPVPGTMLVDDVQLEYTSTASRYNLINNGDFQHGTNGWSGNSQVADPPASPEPNAPKQPPQLSGKAAKIVGDPTTQKRISQTIAVSGNALDSFVYAAWAKGDSASLWEREYETNDRTFAVEMQFNYTNGEEANKFSAQFNPDTEQWQYVAGAGVAQHDYSSITVTLCYDYNINTAYFDGIQLFKEEFGTSYTYYDDGNVESVIDLQKQRTTYEYDTNSNLTKIIEPDGAEMTYTYDPWNNVLTATTKEELVYTFTYDTYGNNTAVSITAGSTKITTSATYSTDGNRLVSTTDALGKKTEYGYNADTNMLEWLEDPEDAVNTRTTYTYDDVYRVESVLTPMDSGNDLYASYTYEDDLLTGLDTMTTAYRFSYGNFGLRTSVKAGESLLAEYTYTNDRNNYLSALDYGNGNRVQYNYDDKGRLTLETFEDGDFVSYTYNSYGNLATVTDSIKISPTETIKTTTTYYYDLLDRMVKYREVSTDTDHTVTYEYDADNNLSSLTENIDGTSHTTDYGYDDDNRVTSVTSGSATEIYDYDAFGRVGQIATNNGSTRVLTKHYTFKNPDSTTTSAQTAANRLQANGYDVTYSYTYDGNGNILSISDGTYTTSYVYDSANQLIRENNQAGGFTHTWEYDNSGNILYRREYAYTTGSVANLTPTDEVEYLYDHEDLGDLLTEYDGQTLYHDDIGNLTDDGYWMYEWEHGRELASMSTGSTTWSFTYDANGMRTRRTNGTMDYRYIYNGSQLTRLTVGSNTLYFAYSADGTPMTVIYNGTTYYYVTNIQGDVIAILNSAGSPVVTYAYDAWGNPLSTTGSMATTLGTHNPLRYRGYVFDQETQLYYLQSRYYSPEQGRFLNADSFVSTGQGVLGNNMFVYCLNNPVNGADPSGRIVVSALILGAFILGGAVLLSGCSNNEPASEPPPYSNKANCYAYAMKLENDPRTGKPFKNKPQPGEFSGNALRKKDLLGEVETVKETINTKVSADAKELGLTYTEVSSADYVVQSGNWLVALVYATDGTDYHWYRRNDDGTWSHKRGTMPITNWDASGNTIIDPKTCNRGIYDGFLGYYEVGPN